MQKDTQKRNHAYKAAMLLKYWKTAREEPLMDLCMIIAMYAEDIETGLLYAVGHRAAIVTDRYGEFDNIKTLSRITVQDKNGKDVLVKSVMNGGDRFHALLLKNGTVRVIKDDDSVFDIALKSEIIAMNSGNYCFSLFIVDVKMRAYEIKKIAIKITGFPDGIKIKDISCGNRFPYCVYE